ncbi:hypothetical protein [Sphingomonas sp. VDB2]|uniref:hypothetical protein n=1 Tax=Sphingomonas sp. VDB2 TaxID=3228751 RepID=UPI003A804997
MRARWTEFGWAADWLPIGNDGAITDIDVSADINNLPSMLDKFLYRFGYETPSEFDSNSTHGTDFESSAACWIMAPSPADALIWGESIAQTFVTQLFNQAGRKAYSWREAQFASWVEDDPNIAEMLAGAPVVNLGESPDFDNFGLRP